MSAQSDAAVSNLLAGEADNAPSADEAPAAKGRTLRPDDELVFPLAKAAYSQYWEAPGTPRSLRIFHGDKEIAIDNPAYFPFGEALIRQSRFRAGDALDWARLEWPKVREMLEQLIRAGLLRYAEDADDMPGRLLQEDRPSPLKPAPSDRPRSWDEFDAVMREIMGRPLEKGYLELVVPVFRVAHMYLDADNRQIGEANVFPPKMRVERKTLWRTCPYSGTRYQPDLPMNVTALRVMRDHWRQMMVVVRRVSDAYRLRFPAVDERGWTVGDIERMTVCVIALPSYLLMKSRDRVENGRLHSALAAAFRLVDGPRTVMHDMVFAPFGEPPRSDATPMTGAELHAYAERTGSFRTAHGICAGPPAMIDDFLAVILDRQDPKGGWPDALHPDIADAIAQIEPAIDYGLTGLQAYATVFSLFSAESAARAGLREIVRAWKGGDSPELARLRNWLEAAPATALADWPAREALRRSRLAAYDEIYANCGFGLTGRRPDPSLKDRLDDPPPLPAETMARLETAFERGLGELPEGRVLAADLAASFGRFLSLVQAALRVALETQERINALLGREAPAQPFVGRDLVRYMALGARPDGAEPKPAAFLIDDIASLIGTAVEVRREGVTIAAA